VALKERNRNQTLDDIKQDIKQSTNKYRLHFVKTLKISSMIKGVKDSKYQSVNFVGCFPFLLTFG